MEVEDIEDDFFSFQPSKPTVPGGGGFSKPGAVRAGRRAGLAVGDAGGGDAGTGADGASGQNMGVAVGASSAGIGLGGEYSGAGADASEQQDGYLPGVGRVGRGRRGGGVSMLGNPQQEPSPGFMAAENNRGAGISQYEAPQQSQPLMGRRASPPTDNLQSGAGQNQPYDLASQQQEHAPAIGGGGYVPSMGRRGRGGSILGLGGGGGAPQVGLNNHGENLASGMMGQGNDYNADYMSDNRQMGGEVHRPSGVLNQGGVRGSQEQGGGSMMQQQPHRQGVPPQPAHMQQDTPSQPHPWQVSAGAHPAVPLNDYRGGVQQQPQPQQQQQAPATQAPAHGLAPWQEHPAPKALGGGGNFKFNFGSRAAGPKAAHAAPAPPQAATHDQSPIGGATPAPHAASARSLSPELPGPAVRASNESNASYKREGGAQGAGSEGSRQSHESLASDGGAGMAKRRKPSGAYVSKSDRLRKLEEELEGMGVTQQLDKAYRDSEGRDRRPRDAAERGFQGARDGAESKLKKLRGGGDGEASRDEVEKAYRQCKIYQDENKELKKKLEQCMNSWEEMARLKNLVAEKVKVISVMEKERGAMHKLHRQYQKDRQDQDGIESEYGERMRRVNEDLRVAKARCNKYRQIQQELESQLAQEQAKGRDLGDKNRALKDKVRAYTALGGKDGTPFDPSTYQNKLQEKDDKIKQLEKDVEVLKKALQQAERRDKNKARENLAGKDHYREQAQMLDHELDRKNKEVKENQVLIRKLQSQMRRMKLEMASLHKLNQDRIKLNAIMGEAPIETPDAASDENDVATSTFLTNLDPDLDKQASQTSSRVSSAASARPLRPAASKSKVGHAGDVRPGGPAAARRGHGADPGTPPTGGQAPSKARGDAKLRKEALAVGKPETPADLAGMLMAHKQASQHASSHSPADGASFMPYGKTTDDGKPPRLQLGAMAKAAAAPPAYEKLLSPTARSVLEDARSWRSATQTMRSNITESPDPASGRAHPAPAEEDEGGYEDDFESVASSRPPASAAHAHPRANGKSQSPRVAQSPRRDSDVGDEVEEEDMDFLLAGLPCT